MYIIPTFSNMYCHDARAIRPDLLQVDFIIFEYRGNYSTATRNELIPSRTVYIYNIMFYDSYSDNVDLKRKKEKNECNIIQ